MSSKTKPATRLYAKIRVADEGDGVRRVTLHNPERRNAIGPQMVNELLYAFEDAHADEDIRAVVVTGEGKAFCAGGDFASRSRFAVRLVHPQRAMPRGGRARV